MRLKTKLVLAITGLVFGVVVVFSWIWMSQLLQQHIEQSFTRHRLNSLMKFPVR